MMFFKWLRKQLLLGAIGFGALWVIERTGDKTGAVVGGPGHYQDGWLFMKSLNRPSKLQLWWPNESR